MSVPVVAFISQLAQSEQLLWLKHLSKLMPTIKIELAAHMSIEQKSQCRIAIIANPLIDEVLTFSNLVWCQSLWAGVDSLFNAIERHQSQNNVMSNSPNGRLSQLKVSRLIDPQLATTMSEAVLTWVLYFHRNMHHYRDQQTRAQWQQLDYKAPSQRHIGILGLGELGQSSAIRLKENGFNVHGWSKHQKQLPSITCYSDTAGLLSLAKKCDIIVCLLPLTPDTTHLINRQFLQALPKHCCLINFARGAIINNNDLLSALAGGNLAHAVLDVFDKEPLPSNHEFWQHEKITVLPHISAPTHLNSASKIVANNIIRYIETGNTPECVDFNKGY